MAKFRERPIVDAWQWDETKEMLSMLESAGMQYASYSSHEVQNYVINLRIRTPVGSMSAHKGDWIVKDATGNFRPCPPEIFAATYEPAD